MSCSTGQSPSQSTGGPQAADGYNTTFYGPKLCQIVRDDHSVDVTDAKDTFRQLGCQVSVYDLPNGYAADALRDFLADLATTGQSFGCLWLLFVGGFASHGRLTVNGAPYSFREMARPFELSSSWQGKPKLFFCHVMHNDCHPSSAQPSDASPFWSSRETAPTPRVGDDLAIAIGGPALLGCLCRVVRGGGGVEFKELMSQLKSMMHVEVEHGISVDFWCDCSGLRYPLYLQAEL